MSTHERISGALGALSEKELEVLQLLTAGHTVKSIAVRLNRSEASINERLRDARRKTGVGSSRELARLLNSQEIWDKKIDLAMQDFAGERLERPANSGHPKPKGTLVMFFALPIAAAGLIVAANSIQKPAVAPIAPAVIATQSPLAGKWALDAERIPADERPQRVTIDFRMDRDKWTTQVEITAADGTIEHAKSTAAPDGTAVPIIGNMTFIDSASLRQPAPNTLVMTLGKNGAPVSTRVYTVSKDRKTMTETIIWASAGLPKLETTYFKRID